MKENTAPNAPGAKQIGLSLLIGAISGACGAYSALAMLIAPAFLGMILPAWGTLCAALSLCCCALTASLLAGIGGGTYIMGVILPSSIAIGYIIMKKQPWRTAVSLSALLLGFGLYAIVCLPSLLNGGGPFDSIKEFMSGYSALLNETLAQMNVSADTAAFTVAYMDALVDSVGRISMQVIVYIAMAAALLDVLIAARLAKKAGFETKPMTPMPLWQLSGNYSYAAIFSLIGALVVLLTGLDNADAVFSLAECVTLGPLALMGLCFLDFTTRLGKPGGRGKRVVIYVLSAVLPYRTLILAFVGLTDRILKTRRHFVPADGSKKDKP